jgi:hypothetical protein
MSGIYTSLLDRVRFESPSASLKHRGPYLPRMKKLITAFSITGLAFQTELATCMIRLGFDLGPAFDYARPWET